MNNQTKNIVPSSQSRCLMLKIRTQIREGRLNALQKQVGCFNHRVVTLVADKLERQWLREVFFGVEV